MKTRRFRQMLNSDRLEFLLEAHNGMSAKIAEEAGFGGIWASGLCLAAQFGVRDSNEASWTQVLEMLEFMVDATEAPIMLDGDTGYGNFNNVRRLVAKLEQRGVAAVCIEDKLFPKTNSFIGGETQPLADMQEFCGKIAAGKDSQRDPDFSIVARVEALIAGWGMHEALRRAEAYVGAGADAILIHSAQSTAEEVLEFKRQWGDRAPLVIVPTKYYATPTEIFEEAGFSMAIWANHLLRSSVTAMRRTAARIHNDGNLMAVENEVATLRDIFQLQGASELTAAEQRYLPNTVSNVRAVVLAASQGDLGDLTADRPKALVEIRGRPLLAHIVAAYERVGIHNVTVVRGYKPEAFELAGLHYVDNEQHATTGELVSFQCALDALDQLEGASETLIVSYGDVLFHKFIPQALCDVEEELAVVVDAAWRQSTNVGRAADYARCSRPDSRAAFFEEAWLEDVREDMPEDERNGEWTGFLRIAPGARSAVRESLHELLSDPEQRRRGILWEVLNDLISRGHRIRVIYVSGHWLDVDSLADVTSAGAFD